MGVCPTRQDLDDNVNSWFLYNIPFEITIIRCFLVKICLHAYKWSEALNRAYIYIYIFRMKNWKSNDVVKSQYEILTDPF